MGESSQDRSGLWWIWSLGTGGVGASAMEQLPTALLQSIIAKVSASDCARAACVARFWNQTVSQDALWEPHCRRDFPTIQKLDPLDRPCSTWKVGDSRIFALPWVFLISGMAISFILVAFARFSVNCDLFA